MYTTHILANITKRLKKSKEFQKVVNPQLVEISVDDQNGVSDKSSPTNPNNNLESTGLSSYSF
ncbi:hypothetical protein HanPSC8_Chr08g0326881 [Helianthus annuus]|nr:hypothetical protein HanPSC8_Chr08g0326881 [Helianthus annuus]